MGKRAGKISPERYIIKATPEDYCGKKLRNNIFPSKR
jgi:hypothetical protein